MAVVTESFLPQINGVTGSVLRVLETFKQREMEALVVAPTSPSSKHLGFSVRTANREVCVVEFIAGLFGLFGHDACESVGPAVVVAVKGEGEVA